MQNIPNQTHPAPGLLAPGQLWNNRSQPVAPPPAPNPPSLQPAQSQAPGLNAPDQLRQLMSGKMPPIGQISLLSPPPADFKDQLGQLQTLMQKADAQALSPYGVVVQSNAQGQVTGYLINGQAASAEQVQQHLLPLATRLHKELMQTKSTVDQEYAQFIQRAQAQMGQMTAVEQNAVRIQLQAVQSIYQGFLNRLSQVDNLIK